MNTLNPRASRSWVAFCLALFTAMGQVSGGIAVALEVKIIKVKYQKPEALCDTLRHLHGHAARFAEAPNVNAIIVSSDRPEIIQAVETLIRELDRRPATLRYEIQSVSSGSEAGNSVTLTRQGSFRPQSHHSSTQSSQTRLVVGLEGQEVALIDQTQRVESIPSAYGYPDQPVVIREDRGMRVRGRLNGNGEVTVEVMNSEGRPNDTRSVATQIIVPLGQWFEIGGAGDRRGGEGNNIGLSNGRIEGQMQTNRRNDAQTFRLRITVMPDSR